MIKLGNVIAYLGSKLVDDVREINQIKSSWKPSILTEVKVCLTLLHYIFEHLVCTIVLGVLQTLFHLFLIRQGLLFPLYKFSIRLSIIHDI